MSRQPLRVMSHISFRLCLYHTRTFWGLCERVVFFLCPVSCLLRAPYYHIRHFFRVSFVISAFLLNIVTNMTRSCYLSAISVSVSCPGVYFLLLSWIWHCYMSFCCFSCQFRYLALSSFIYATYMTLSSFYFCHIVSVSWLPLLIFRFILSVSSSWPWFSSFCGFLLFPCQFRYSVVFWRDSSLSCQFRIVFCSQRSFIPCRLRYPLLFGGVSALWHDSVRWAVQGCFMLGGELCRLRRGGWTMKRVGCGISERADRMCHS